MHASGERMNVSGEGKCPNTYPPLIKKETEQILSCQQKDKETVLRLLAGASNYSLLHSAQTISSSPSNERAYLGKESDHSFPSIIRFKKRGHVRVT